jgi:hypothetical protein
VSGGFFAAMACCGLADWKLIIRQVQDLYSESKVGPMSNVLKGMRKDYFPKIINRKAFYELKGQFYACLTLPPTRNILVNSFDSIEEFMDVGVAGCWIPGVFGITPQFYRGELAMDGGLTDNFPLLDEDSVLVTPTSLAYVPENKKRGRIVVSAKKYPITRTLLNNHPETPRESFIDGYLDCKKRVFNAKPLHRSQVELLFEEALEDHKNWRD